MRFEIETGTDTGAIAIADPSLTVALRSSTGRNADRHREEAVANGNLWRADTGADGSYLIHLFVDEDPPAAVAPFLRDPLVVETFHVPSGQLLVAGEEFVAASEPLAKYPHMGSSIELPAGTYELTAFRLDEARDDDIERRFAAEADPREKRAWEFGNALPMICVGLTIAALITGYVLQVTGAPQTATYGLAVIVAIVWIWQAKARRTPEYTAAERLYRRLERELPSIVVVLRSRSVGAAG